MTAVGANAADSAMNFDATTDYVNLGNDASLHLSDNFTIEAWINPQSVDDTTIFGQGTSDGIQFKTRDGKLVFVDRYVKEYYVSNVVADGIWQHVAVTRDAFDGTNSTLKFYVNGKLVGTATATLETKEYTGDSYLGCIVDKSEKFDGDMDEVRIWNDVRTDAEIAANFNTSKLADTSNLVSHYDFNEGSGALLADSQGTNSGTVSGTPTWPTSVLGNRGCINFDGNGDYIDLGTTASISGTGAFTLEAWIKTSGSDKDQAILSQKTTYYKNVYKFLVLPTGEVQLYTYDGSFQNGTSTNTVNDGKWHHVAAVRDASGNMKIYIDGVDDTNGAPNSAVNLTGLKTVVGDSTLDANERFNGEIDEIRIWNADRTQTQIRENMFREFAGAQTDLVGYYTFDGKSGATLYDYSANGASGTFVDGDDLDALTDGLAWRNSGSVIVNEKVTDHQFAASASDNLGNVGLTLDVTLGAGNHAYFAQVNKLDGIVNDDPSSGVNREERVWFVGNVGSGNTVDLTFDATSIGGAWSAFMNGNTYVLLHRTSEFDNYTVAATNVHSAATGATHAFTNVALKSGFYTFAEDTNIGTPAYGVEVAQSGNELSWSVDYEDGVVSYKVQQNVDGVWTTVTNIAAKGEVDSVYSLTVDGSADYRIVAVDASGFQQIFAPATANSVNVFVSINAGWNLISVPCEGTDLSSFETLWGWDGTQYVTVENPAPMQGLWVYSAESSEINLTGTKVASGEVILKEGWNLFGPAENCIAPAGLQIFSWDQNYQDLLEGSDALVQGRGYWFYSDKVQHVNLK